MAVGILLGAGSPLGLAILRLVARLAADAPAWVAEELSSMGAVYAYTGVATAAVFGFAGYILGRRADNLNLQAAQLQRSASEFERLSITDGLTGLYARNYELRRLREEWLRARRYAEPLSCLFIDIDRFKSLNDRYGHPFGDRVLKNISQAIKKGLRSTDILGRYGGDEFLAILPQTEARRAYQAAERVRQAVMELQVPAGDEHPRLSVSIGVFSGRDIPAAFETVLQHADAALRQAKDAGRNRSVLYAGGENALKPQEEEFR